MNGCIDKQIGSMLHHYELGLLDDRERLLFEQHLLECDACFAGFQSLQEATHLMKVDPSLRELAHTEGASESDDSPADIARPSYLHRFKLRYVTAFAVAAAVLLFLILKDWQFEIGPSQEAVAFENRLVIMYFENLADEADSGRIGEIAANLLVADLSESHYLQVVSFQRVHDILRQLGKEDRKIIARDLARDVAVQTHSRWLLFGRIVQIEPNLIVATDLVDAQSGQIRASRQIESISEGDIFSIVDSLTVLIKQDMTLPADALLEPDRSVADVTTSSSEAYRYYLEGIEHIRKFYELDAAASFKKALEFDSTFAMAYYYLSIYEDQAYIDRAVQYAEGISWRERMYILSRAAFISRDYLQAAAHLEQLLKRDPEDKKALLSLADINYALGNYEKSVEFYRRVTAIDPLNEGAYNMLAYSYHELDIQDSSIWAINKYIELAPDEVNPYDTRGDLYASTGRLSEAISSYREALRIKPDFYRTLEKLGHMYVFKNDYQTADSCYQILTKWDNPEVRSRGRNHLIYIPLHQGRFSKSLEMIEECIRMDELDDQTWSICHFHQLKALIYSENERSEAALTAIRQCLDSRAETSPDDDVSYRDFYISILAQSGKIDRAESLAVEFQAALEKSALSPARYWYALAMVERYKGNLDSAAACFDRYADETDISPYFSRHFWMARTYLDAGRLADAVAEFERLISQFGSIQLYWGIYRTQSHYYLGRAYEESQWLDRAIEQYRIFLDQWRDSDYTGPELEDARLRLDELRNKKS